MSTEPRSIDDQRLDKKTQVYADAYKAGLDDARKTLAEIFGEGPARDADVQILALAIRLVGLGAKASIACQELDP